MQEAPNQQQIGDGPLPQQFQQGVIEHQQVNVERQPAVVVEPRDYTAEICAIMGNVTSMQIDIKMPEFHDENMSNPLEFLDNFERFCITKNIKNNDRLKILNIALHSKARHWYELQNPFANFEQFKISFQNEFYGPTIQINYRDKWSSRKFNNKEDKNLQTFYYS